MGVGDIPKLLDGIKIPKRPKQEPQDPPSKKTAGEEATSSARMQEWMDRERAKIERGRAGLRSGGGLAGEWEKAKELPRNLIGIAAKSGEAIIEGGLRLGEATIGYIGDPDHGNPLEDVHALDIIPAPAESKRKARENLDALPPITKAIGEGIGMTLSFAAGGGGAGAIGKIAGAPGKAVEALGSPAVQIGRKILEKVPAAVPFAAQMKSWIPPLAGATQGFSFYNGAIAEGGLEEKAAAAALGAAQGAVLHIAGTVAQLAEKAIMNGIRVDPRLLDPTKIAKDATLLRKLGAKAVGSAIEGTGFAGLDTDWWADMASGDGDRVLSALGVWMGSVAGSAAIRTGSPQGYLFFKRSNPELNVAALREPAGQAAPGERSGQSLPGDPGSGDPAQSTPEQPAGSPARPEEAGSQATTEASAPTPADRSSPNPILLDPLYQSGWEGRGGQGRAREGNALEFPGSTIEILPDGSVKAEGKTYAGAEAQAAIQGIALRSLEARMIGEVVFGAHGYDEAGAGLHWVGHDGAGYAIGLDGSIYRRNIPPDPGESWAVMGEPPAIPDGPQAHDPGIQRWREMVVAWRQEFGRSPALDVLHAAIETAAKGRMDSPSVNELAQVLAAVPADQVAHGLTNATLPALAMELGKLGAGTSNAQAAMAGLARAMQPKAMQPKPAADHGGEAGMALVPTAKEMAAAGKRAAGLVETVRGGTTGKFSSRVTEELSRRVPDAKLPGMARQAYSRRRGLHGEARDPHREVERLARGDTRQWLDTFVPDRVAGFESTRLKQLVENRGVTDQVPDQAAQAVQKFRDFEALLWNQAVAAGDVRPSRKTGQTERMTEMVDPGKLPRQRGDGFDKVMNTPALRNKLAQGLAEGNGIELAKIEAELEPLWQESAPQPDRDAAYNKLRTLEWFPDAMVDDGTRYEILEGKTIEAADRMLHGQTAHTATISVFGPDLSKADAERLGETRPGVRGALKEFAKQADEPTRKMATDMMTRLAGGAGDQPLITPWGGKVPKWALEAESTRRSAETVLSGMHDVPDPLVAYGMYGGWGRMMQAMREVGVPGSEAYHVAMAEAARFGSVMEETGQYAFGEARGAQAKLRSALGLFSKGSEKWKQVIGDRMAKKIVEDMKAGRIDKGIIADLRMTGFSPAEMTLMVEGRGGELYDMFRREFVSQSTSNFLPGEGSVLQGSRNFNFWLPYNRLWMGRMRSMLRLAPQAFSGPNKLTATRRLIGVMFGAAVAGQFSNFLSYVIAQGTDGPERWWKEFSYAPGWSLATQGGLQLVGGALATLGRTIYRATETGEQPDLLALTAPGRLLSAGFDSARKIVRGEERTGPAIIKLFDRIGAYPELQAARGFLALVGTQDHEIQDVAKDINRWKRAESRPVNKPQPIDSERIPFRLAMSDVEDAMRQAVATGGDPLEDKKLATAIQTALGVSTGREIAASLRGRKLFNDPALDDPEDREKLMTFLGEERTRMAHHYDYALEMLAKHYARETGTPSAQDPFETRLSRVRTLAAIGDPSGLKDMFDEVADSNAERRRLKLPFDQNVDQLAVAIADHPDLWPRILSESQVRQLRTGRDPLRTIRHMIVSSAVDRDSDRQRREAQKGR